MAKDPASEERLGALLRLLPPAPGSWVQAARELPATRRALDQILVLAGSDAEFRRDLIADLDDAVRRAGHQPDPRLIRDLRSALNRER